MTSRFRSLARLAIVLAVALGGGSAGAQDDVVPGDAPSSLVGPSLERDSIATVTVITREQIQARGADSLGELLRTIPGVHVDEAGGRGGVTSLYMRGGEANYTLVLIDGVVVNDPMNSRGGSFDFSFLGTENIDRIEVARGPLPASWGATAMAGAVHIVTRRGEPDGETALEAAAGRDGYWRGLLEASRASGPLEYSLSFASTDAGVPVPGSEFRSDTLASRFSYEVSDGLSVRGTFRFSDSNRESFTDASGGPRLAASRAVEDRDTRFTLAGVELRYQTAPWWRQRLELAYFDQKEDLITPPVLAAPGVPVFPLVVSDADFTRNEVTWHNTFALDPRLEVTAGIQGLFERGSSRGFIDFGGFALPAPFSSDRDVVAPYLEIDARPVPALRLQAGARFDSPHGEDKEWSPRLGASYTSARRGTTVRASYGQGFKLPSFFALAHPFAGDPDLAPERSETFELGVTQRLAGGAASLDATFFHSEFENLIDFDPLSGLLVNRGRVVSYGWELGAAAQPRDDLGVRVHVTFARTDIRGDPSDLRNRPEWRGGVSLRWRPSARLDTALDALYVGAVPDFAVPVGEETLDRYTRVDASVRFEVAPGLVAFASVENLLDASYEEFLGFPAPGLTARAGLRFQR